MSAGGRGGERYTPVEPLFLERAPVARPLVVAAVRDDEPAAGEREVVAS
jgi:hypothetical protein